MLSRTALTMNAPDAPTRSASALRARARPASPAELAMIPWVQVLSPRDQQRVAADVQVAEAEPGDLLCKIGRRATLWLGVVDGLLKMTNDAAADVAITYSGLPPGAWFGEGTLLKRENYRYNIEALRHSVVAGLPIETFEWLLERSIPFNRYLMNQLNERVSQFIAARETDRLNEPDSRVARSLAGLFHPVLFPGVGTVLRITQQELAYLVGLSRQRVNEALRALQADGLIRVEYGGVQVLDLERLRRYRRGPNPS